jgi:MFS family permease
MKYVSKKSSWMMWLVPTAFYALVFMLRVAPGILKSDIMNYYQLDNFKFSLIPAFYYAGYASMQIPVSFYMDRFKLHKVIALLIFATGVGVMLLSRSCWFPLALLGCFIIGTGNTVGVLGSSNIVNTNFSQKSYSFVFGLTLTAGLLAATCAGKIISTVAQHFNWQATYSIVAGICLVLTVAALVLIKTPKGNKKVRVSLPSTVSFIFKNKFVILVSIFSGFLTSPVQGFADVWGPGFLSDNLGFEKSTAISLNSLCFLGYGIGAPIIGKLAQKYNVLRKSLIACGAVMLFSFLIILFVPNLNSTTVGVLLFLGGVGSAFPPLTFAIVLHNTRKELNNVAIGISNMTLMLFGSIYHIFIGLFYKASPLLGISIVPIGLIIGTIGTILLFRKKIVNV